MMSFDVTLDVTRLPDAKMTVWAEARLKSSIGVADGPGIATVLGRNR
jgi:hypothetical protein